MSTELERSIRIGPVDFIASLGGLFGLCLGFSIASFFEIIYWFTIVLSRFLLKLIFFVFFLQLSDVQERWEKCAQIICFFFINPDCNNMTLQLALDSARFEFTLKMRLNRKMPEIPVSPLKLQLLLN